MLLSLLVMFLVVHPAMVDQEQPGTQELIEKICRQMEEYGFCYKTFNENLKSPSTDIVGLTQITLQQAIINSSNTHDFIVQLLGNTTDEGERNALMACENGYSTLKRAFEDAFFAFTVKDYKSMMTCEAVTPKAEASCEQSFNPENPMVERNREMRILLAMALVAGHILVDTS